MEQLSSSPTSVAICETQPLTASGAAATLASAGFDIVLQVSSLDELRLRALSARPRLALIDKAAGLGSLPSWLEEAGTNTLSVIWGSVVTEAEAVRLLHAGVRGILRKTASAGTLVACARAVQEGRCWMEEDVVRAGMAMERQRSALTPREQQVAALVENGLRNRDIARELGIRPGTVKIHLKHIFEKTGIRGRYGLALSGLQHRGLLALSDSMNGVGELAAVGD